MPATAARAASRGRPRWPIFLGLAALVFVADQVTKAWLTSFLAPGERVEILGEYLRLVHSQNSGALFGLFQDQAILFGIVSVGVVAGIVWFHHGSGRNTLLSVALGLLLGGALGNMADRFRIGYVVDFVDVGIGGLRFYTFNVADSAISLSILLLLVSAFVADRPDSGAATAGTTSETAVSPGPPDA